MVRKTKFVQLGEKVNGRIRKNEQYSIDKFVTQALSKVVKPGKTSTAVPNFWQRLSEKKVIHAMDCAQSVGFSKGYQAALKDLKKNINEMIDEDNFGKKK